MLQISVKHPFHDILVCWLNQNYGTWCFFDFTCLCTDFVRPKTYSTRLFSTALLVSFCNSNSYWIILRKTMTSKVSNSIEISWIGGLLEIGSRKLLVHVKKSLQLLKSRENPSVTKTPRCAVVFDRLLQILHPLLTFFQGGMQFAWNWCIGF